MAQYSRQPIFVSSRNAPLGSYIQESQQSFRKLTAYYWILRDSDERKVGQGEGQVGSFSETYNDPVTFQSFVLRHLLMAPVHKKKLPKFVPPLVTSGFPFFSSLVTLLAGGISRALAHFGRLTNPEKIEGTLVVITYLTNFMLDIAHSKREIQHKRIYQSLTNKVNSNLPGRKRTH